MYTRFLQKKITLFENRWKSLIQYLTSYVYIFSGQKLIKTSKMVNLASIEKLKWDNLGDFQTLW